MHIFKTTIRPILFYFIKNYEFMSVKLDEGEIKLATKIMS